MSDDATFSANPPARGADARVSRGEDLDELQPRIAARDADAFATWLRHCEPELRRALRPFAAHVDVEAVLQESLLRVWVVAPRFKRDGRPNGLLRLAFRIAKNHAVSEARRLRPDSLEGLLLESVEEPVSPAALPDPMLRSAIQECRDKLPPQPARALEQRIASAGNEPDATLADRVGMRLNTFLQNVTRARRLIAECLRARGIDPEACS